MGLATNGRATGLKRKQTLRLLSVLAAALFLASPMHVSKAQEPRPATGNLKLQGQLSLQPIDRSRIVFTVTPDATTTLKPGAPLTQTIHVRRQGRCLMMDCQLTGTGGESYSNSGGSTSPTFHIFKDGKEIAAGKFEYG